MVFGRRSGKRIALVVGGAGFLGKHIVQQLLDTGRYNVRVFDIRPCGIEGADMVVGDIRKQEVRSLLLLLSLL
jgi:sterol-4alpha-carboxylate 3-dehydrogenase (decarboxylating)